MSKNLEELKDLENAFIGHCEELKCEENYIKVCEHKFDNVEKSLKALEIIKEKLPPLLHRYLLDYCNKEEYDLLNEVLKNE